MHEDCSLLDTESKQRCVVQTKRRENALEVYYVRRASYLIGPGPIQHCNHHLDGLVVSRVREIRGPLPGRVIQVT